MKNSTKKLVGLLLMIGALMVVPQQIYASTTSDATIIITKDNLVGGWEYTAAGAPEGYDSGLLMIVKTGDVYKVQVQLAAGALNATDIVVKGNDITFKLNVEGESVSVSLSAKGGQISGTSTSASGTYSITGVKSISPQ